MSKSFFSPKIIKVINFAGVLRGEFWDFFVWKYIPIMIFFSLRIFNKNLFETLKKWHYSRKSPKLKNGWDSHLKPFLEFSKSLMNNANKKDDRGLPCLTPRRLMKYSDKPWRLMKYSDNIPWTLTHDLIFWYIFTIRLWSFPVIPEFNNLCHNALLHTVSSAFL